MKVKEFVKYFWSNKEIVIVDSDDYSFCSRYSSGKVPAEIGNSEIKNLIMIENENPLIWIRKEIEK